MRNKRTLAFILCLSMIASNMTMTAFAAEPVVEEVEVIEAVEEVPDEVVEDAKETADIEDVADDESSSKTAKEETEDIVVEADGEMELAPAADAGAAGTMVSGYYGSGILDANSGIIYNLSTDYNYSGEYYAYIYFDVPKETGNNTGTFDISTNEITIERELTVGADTYTISSIKSITLPKDNKIKTINISEGIKWINGACINNLTQVETINFPSTIEHIEGNIIVPETTGDYKKNNLADDPGRITVKKPKWLENATTENGVVYIGKVAAFCPETDVEDIVIKDSVTEILPYFAVSNNKIKSVKIPSGTATIYAYSFGGCKNLKTVSLPDDGSLKKICYEAFYRCESVEEFYLPKSVTTIEAACFLGCIKMKKFVIPEDTNLQSIGYEAFGWHGYNVVNEYVHGNQTALKMSAGYTDKSTYGAPIEEINIPVRVFNSSDVGLFAGNDSLKKVKLISDNSVYKNSIPFMEFMGCSNLETVEGLENVSGIGIGSFALCKSLKSVNFEGVTSISDFAFMSTGLREVILPESVYSVGHAAFENCTSLTKMNFVGRKSFSCGLLRNVLGIGTNYFNRHDYFEKDEEILKDTSITYELYREKFPDSTALKEIVITGVEGKSILDNNICDFLQSVEKVTMTDDIKIITYQAFFNDLALKDIHISENVEDIRSEAFYFDSKIDVDFSKLKKLKKIGTSAFRVHGVYGYDRMNTLYEDLFDMCCMKFPENYGIKNIVLPDSIESIGSGAFFGQQNVQNVVIPEGVKSIEGWAFQFLTNLKNIEIYTQCLTRKKYDSNTGKYHKEYGDDAWNSMFWNQRSESLERIVLGEKFFGHDGESGPWEDVGVWKLEESVFFDSTADTIDIRADYKNVGRAMFYKDKFLTDLEIPETVETIAGYAFAECKSLYSLIIPEKTESVGVNAFGESGVRALAFNNPDTIIAEPVIPVFDGSCAMGYFMDDPERYREVYKPLYYVAYDAVSDNAFKKYEVSENAIEMVDNLVLYDYVSEADLIAHAKDVLKDKIAIDPNTVILGYENSTAEAYAKRHGNKFEVIDDTVTSLSINGIESACSSGEVCEVEYSSGGEDYTVSLAGTSFSNDHILRKIADGYEATCTETGMHSVWQCSNCENYFGDPYGNKLITEDDFETDPLGHDYEGTVTKPATETETGIMTYVCKHNSEHTYTAVIPVVVPATIKEEVTIGKSSAQITADNGGGELEGDLLRQKGKKYVLNKPEREGYAFKGWYDENGKKVTTLTEKYIKKDGTINLTAKWTANTYKVTYTVKAPAKKSKITNKPKGKSYKYDETFNLPLNVTATDKAGNSYEVTEWVDKAGNSYKPGQEIKNLAGKTKKDKKIALKAVWKQK